MTSYDQLWSVMSSNDRTWHDVTPIDHLWPPKPYIWLDTTNNFLSWAVITMFDKKRLDMTNYDKLWPTVTSYDQSWQPLAKLKNPSKEIVISCGHTASCIFLFSKVCDSNFTFLYSFLIFHQAQPSLNSRFNIMSSQNFHSYLTILIIRRGLYLILYLYFSWPHPTHMQNAEL